MRLVGLLRVAHTGICCAIAACSHGAAATTEPLATHPHYVERVQDTRPHQSEQFRGLMSEHFGFAAWARDAATVGDVVAAQDALLQLANYAYDQSVPGAWLPRVRALQADARDVARATTIASLAQGVARLGRACGECHVATGGGPARSGAAPEPPIIGPDSFPDRMFRHRRAIMNLWLGLVAPSDRAWNEGASSLASASAELHAEKPLPAEFQQAMQSLGQLGAQARQAHTQLERAERYGELLGACADCHQRAWPSIL